MKKLILALILGLAVSACGKKESQSTSTRTITEVIHESEPCHVNAINGGAEIVCPDGSRTELHDGLPGQDGQDGTPGQDGAPGSSITVVQLCSGAVTDFPEQALCIGNQLYGVFWDHGNAFLAIMPRGTYRSTGPQACIVTVVSGCTITH